MHAPMQLLAITSWHEAGMGSFVMVIGLSLSFFISHPQLGSYGLGKFGCCSCASHHSLAWNMARSMWNTKASLVGGTCSNLEHFISPTCLMVPVEIAVLSPKSRQVNTNYLGCSSRGRGVFLTNFQQVMVGFQGIKRCLLCNAIVLWCWITATDTMAQWQGFTYIWPKMICQEF